jgi:hypothetical protein
MMRAPRMLKLLLAATTAALALGLAVSSASANHLSVNRRSVYIIWHPLTFTAVGETVECNVTFLGSFHETTIEKVSHALIGAVTHVEIANPCTGGTATILPESLPWHVTYEGFTGELPNIERVRILLLGATFDVFLNSFGTSCLGQTEEGEPAAGWAELERGGSGSIDNIRADESLAIGLNGGFLCSLAESATFSGNGSVEDGNGELIVVRLI